MIIAKHFEFEAAHHLPNYNGKCANLHGHSYKLTIEVEGPVNEKTGMVMDFGELKDIVNTSVIDKLDHQDLNTILENPTAENLIKWIFLQFNGVMPETVSVKSITLYETSKGYAKETYY